MLPGGGEGVAKTRMMAFQGDHCAHPPPQILLSPFLLQDSLPPVHPLKAVPIAVADEGESESEDDDLKPRGEPGGGFFCLGCGESGRGGGGRTKELQTEAKGSPELHTFYSCPFRPYGDEKSREFVLHERCSPSALKLVGRRTVITGSP